MKYDVMNFCYMSITMCEFIHFKAHITWGSDCLFPNDLLYIHQKIKYSHCVLCNICVKLCDKKWPYKNRTY
jgi:hypothetical protein